MNISAKTLSHYTARTLALLPLLLLASCANTNYQDYYASNDLVKSYCRPELVTNPLIVELDHPSDVQHWRAMGYEVYGSSSFCGLWTPRTSAIDVARKLGTPLVLVCSHFKKEEKKQEIHMVPQLNYGYNYGNVYGYYGTVYNYSGSTTSTTYVPVAVSYTDRYYSQTAFFLTKRNLTNDYGVYFRKPTNTPGQKPSTNVIVDVVIAGSKAETHGIRPGDTLKSINGKAIASFAQAETYMNGIEPINSMVVSHE